MIEVVVAMVLLSIVVTGAVMATSSSERAGVRTKAVADMNSIAERAFERAHGDLSARSYCENAGAGWKAAAAAHTRSGSNGPATFRACTPPAYTDFTDEQGRNYTVQVTIQPVDSSADGSGSSDADNNLRDDYQVRSRVSLDGANATGLESMEPLEVNGSLDWQENNSDLATVRIYACGINKADRSLTVGGCSVRDGNRSPLGGVRVQLTPAPSGAGWNNAAASTITSSSSGVGEALATVEPGSYRMVAPSTFTDTSGVRWNLMRVDPSGLQISGSGRYDVNVTYVREVIRTINFCTQIMTPYATKDGETFDDGFEAYSTNLNYRGTGNPGYRSVRIDTRRDRQWACARVTAQPGTTATGQPWIMYDPLRYDVTGANGTPPPPIGQYDLEIEQNYGDYRNVARFGVRVSAVSIDCSTGLAWNRPLDGAPVPTRAQDPLNDRPLTPGETTPWYGRYDLQDDRSHRVCIRLEPKTLDRDRCTGPSDPNGAYRKGAPRTVPNGAERTGKCFYWKTECVQYCPDGARICVANCSYQWRGTTSATLQGEAAKPFGGPADPTVGCRPKQQGGYRWFGWTPSVIFEGRVGQSTPESTWKNYEWVGGGQVYYEGWTGHYSSGPVYYCQDIAFAASSRYLCEQGNNTPVYTGNGFVECRYHFGDCIQAELPQYPGVYVRGIMRDISTNYEKPIIPDIAALRYLAIVNGIDKPETITGWDPGTWWDALDIKIREVNGDPSCGDDGVESTWPRWDDVDPVMVDIWYRIVDEPALAEPVARNPNGNVGSDRVAI